jgi:hypothetical protein
MKKIVFSLLWLFVLLGYGYAQNSGIKGRVIDESTGEFLIGATVMIDGTTKGTITDFDGNYVLNLEPGSYNIMVQFVSYEAEKIEGVLVNPDEYTKLDIILSEAVTELQSVRVVAKANRESENLLMLEQKKSNIAIESIGAQELSTKGVSNAASAVTKLTGITLQEGTKMLNIRGLGDRYNTTTLNGLPIPSNNPELKNIDLELFTTDIIANITVKKSFSPDLYADFAGANIDIESKRFVGDDFFKIDVKTGINTSLFDTEEFSLQQGPSLSGFYDVDLPDVEKIQDQTKYDFENPLNPQSESIYPILGLGISGGKSVQVNDGNELNSFFTLSFDNERIYTNRIERIVNGSDLVLYDLRGDEFHYVTQTTGMLNLNLSRPKSQYYYNGIVLNSSDQGLLSIDGKIRDVGDNALRRVAEFERNFIVINQLLGEHEISNTSSINWGVAYNYVYNTIPDRFRNTFLEYDDSTNIGAFDPEAAGINYRYFQSFEDDELAGNIVYEKQFGEKNNEKSKGIFNIGYSGRYKIRSFQSNQFDHAIELRPGFQPVRVDIDDVDSFINNENFIEDEFDVNVVRVNDEVSGFTYDGTIRINAAFASLEYNFSPEFMAMIGARYENVNLELDYLSVQTGSSMQNASFNEQKFLPSLTMKYAMTDQSNLRLSASKTYTLPKLQEMPLIVFDGITDRVWGNPYLYPSDVYNAEVKWELFPRAGEMISAAAFGKYIEDPINKFAAFGFLNEYANANTGDWAQLYGFELDAKKYLNLTITSNENDKIVLSGNLTFMKTRQELDEDKIKDETNNTFFSTFMVKTEELEGAAPFIGNVAIGYNSSWNDRKNKLSSTLVYNYVSERLYAIGHSNLGNKYDMPLHTLDFVVKNEFNDFELGFSAKNLLNQTIKRIQYNSENDWVVRSYKKGITFKLSLAYNF